ncbi:FecR family protein [Pleionea sp. CnH1-48]|uniref:FecR family protein n=1 Tax=Pleionea sp. CnH1-48 TaxID=2954494 RepID=UPI0020985F25|nr:FecR family protein [Pleionea sp. CnH1-48]MCO7227480.1 FecR family protein [Pleionea sp. CnH1-48]
MTNQETSIQMIRDTASDWLVRMETGELNEQEESAFVDWLTADERHQDIFAEMEQTWLDAASLPTEQPSDNIEADVIAMPAQASNATSSRNADIIEQQTTTQSQRPWWAWAVAASLMFGLISAPGLWLSINADYQTATGEWQTVTLADNSVIELNTDSAIQVSYSDNQRHITLLRGEAYFDVAKDPARPFIVTAGDVNAQALGTEFAVQLTNDEQTIVTVTEHEVGVSSTDSASEKPMAIVTEGEQIAYQDTFSTIQKVNHTQATAWRTQRLVFNDQSLQSVITELNRYHRGHITLYGDHLKTQKVNGVFNVKDPVATLKKLEQSLPITVTQMTPYLIVVSSK